MNKIKYRILALLLCFTMVLSSFSGASVDAAMAAEAGTESEAAGTETTSTEATGTEATGTEATGTEATAAEVTATEAAGTEATAAEATATEVVGTEVAGTETTSTEATATEIAGTEATDAAALPESEAKEAQDASTVETAKTTPDIPNTETEEQADTSKALTLTQTVEGYQVVLTANAGVLPADAVLTANLIKSSAATEKIETAIEKEMDAGKKLAETIAFDITIYDKDGNEIQPDTTKGNVTVTFQNIEPDQSAATEAEVFHVQDDYSSADAVYTQTKGDEVAFQAEHFSTYVITFFCADSNGYHDYSLSTSTSLKVSDLLTKLNIPFSNITSATSDTEAVLTVTGSGNATGIEGVGTGTAALTVNYDYNNVSDSNTVDITVSAVTGTCGANLTWSLSGSDGNYTLTISGTGVMTDYTSSYSSSFDQWKSNAPWSTIGVAITTLVIGEGVTSIGSGAFAGLSKLTGALTIPTGVTSIGANAFGGCTGLTGALTIPTGVTSIGASAFYGCTGLTGDLTIPSGVTSIGASAFKNCTGLTGNLTIQSGVTSIGANAFENCTGLTGNLTIQSGVTSIGDYAFTNCYRLTGGLTIPTGVTSIGSCAFLGCSGLTGNLTISSGVTSIGEDAFDGCDGLSKAVIPGSVQTIGSYAFAGWKAGSTIYNLSSVTMTDGTHYSGATLGAVYTLTTHVDGVAAATKVPGDGESTFSVADPTKDGYVFLGWYTDAAYTTKWDSTKAVTGDMDLYARFVKLIEKGSCGAEGDGSNLTYMVTTADDTNYTLTISGSGAMADYSGETPAPWLSYRTSLTALVLEEGIKNIGNNAFYNCYKFIGNLTIPDSVTSIGDYAFCACSGFTGALTIPSGVTSIGESEFDGCSGFNGSLTIPSGVTGIGARAFNNCSGLTGSLTIPSGVTSIGDYAFESCYGLTGDLTIPSEVTSIGEHAFSNCSGFTGALTIPSGVTSIGTSAFESCYGLTGDLTIPSGVTSIGDYAFYNCYGLTGSLTIPSGVTSIGNYVFQDCYGLTGDLTIPSGVTSIGDYAFGGCYGFTGALTIPSGVTSIANYVFENCSGLTGTLTIPSGVTSIGENAFMGCSGFTGALTIPSGVTSIGENAFGGCSGFTGALTIPASVTSIVHAAFYGCEGLSKIVIPQSVTSIGNSAFYIKNSTTKIYNLSEVTLTEGNQYYSADNLGTVYTVTTHVNGVTTATKVPGDGETTFSVADPTKANSEFLGWYTDSACTTKWNSTKAITGNMDLYAAFSTTIASGNCGAEGDGSNLTYKITTTDDTNYTLTISGSGAMADYSSETPAPWYSNNDKLTVLVLNEGITKIGKYAFFSGSKLKGDLAIPDSVTSIGYTAFYECSGLTGNLTISDNVTNIGELAFYGCSGLTGDLTIPDSVTSLGNGAFYNCSSLTGNLTIPDSVTSLGNVTFYGCEGLTGNLTIPDSVTSIGDNVFCGCKNLSKIIVPKSVTSIADRAFYIENSTTKIYNLSNVTLTQGNHYYSADNLGTVYTVATYIDGIVTSSQKVLGDGETTVTIADPVKEGYAFLGWYTDSSFATDKLWNGNNKTVSANLNLYAKLQKILAVGDISKISNTDAFTYNGSKELPVTLTLSGYDPTGTGAPILETATATAKVSSADAGTYTGYTLSNIVLTSGTDSNYTLTGITDGSITINSTDAVKFGITIDKAPVTVTAADVTLSVGDTMPELTDSSLTFTGFVNGEDKAVLGGTLDFTFSQNHTNSEVSNGTVTPGGYTSINYAISYVPGKLVVNAKTFGSTPYTASGSNNGKTGAGLWYTGDITLTPDSTVCGNFKYISISTNGGSTYSDWSTQAVIPSMDGTTPLDTGSGSVVVKLSTADARTPGTDCAVVTLNDPFTYQLDTTAPKGTITIETNAFKSFLHTITFGLLFNKDITVSIAPESSPAELSGTTTYLYKDTTTSTTAKTYAELEALSETSDVTTGWKQTGSFSVTADDRFAVYGKIVDGAGHVTYLNTDGVIVDKTAPVITDISLPMETRTDVTAGLNLTTDEAGAYYYMVLKNGDTAPATGEEIAQMTAPICGSGAIGKNVKSAIYISGLTANTGYYFYVTVKDAAGNYSDIIQTFLMTQMTKVTIVTVPAITGTYGQQVSGMTITDGVAKVGETTIPGTWSFTGTYTDIPSVGTQTLYSVFFTPDDSGTYETAFVNVIPTITARSLTAAGVTVSDVSGTYTYTGKAVIPGLSVTDTGATITADDYDIAYSHNIEAGENTASVTVTGKGNYTGTVTKTFSIAKADAAITVAAGSESYTKTFGDAAFSLTGITKNGDGTLTYASSNTSVATVSTEGTVTIKGAGTTDITVSLAATDNYNAATDKTITVTVGKAAALSIADITKSYLYTTGTDSESIDLLGLLPNDRGETTYLESVTDTANILSNTPAVSAAGTLTYSVNPGATGDTATINVTATMANYKDTALKVVIDLTEKTVVDITGITVAGKTYDGEAAAVTGTVSVKKTGTTESVTIDGLAYSYTSTDGKGYDSSTAPTAAGSYQLIISVPDSNKTYKGSSGPISFTIAKKPVFIVTEPAITGTYGQKVCDMTLTDGVVKAGDAQIPGSWSFVSSYTDVPSVDSHTAYSILFTPDDNYMPVTAEVIPTITPRSLTADGITVSDVSGTYTYTGEAFTPGITVTDTKAAITAADYNITYNNNSGAGVNTASVTVTGKGNYIGTVTKTFSIAKADTAITVAAGNESYAKTFKDAAFSLTGITKTGDGTLAYASSKPSVATVSAEGTVTIKGAGTTNITVSLAATDNCNAAADKTITVTVGKAAALTIADITKSYTYTTGTDSESIDLSAILPKDKGQTSYQLGTITDKDAILNEAPAADADGMLTYAVKAGTKGDTATINVTASMANYEDTTMKVVVNLTDKTVVDITGITIADKTYDGKATTVTGTVSVKKTGTTESVTIDGLTYAYTSTDGKGYDSSTAPTAAGSYQLVISVPGSNKTYIGNTNPITFTIAKKTVTVKALDKEIQTGAAIPSLASPIQDTDYTVTGLVESDKLSGTVTMQYAAAPDNTKAGSTAIIIAGVTAGDNYSLSLINGTLTIKQAESTSTDNQTPTATDSQTTTTTDSGTTPGTDSSITSGTSAVSTESTGATTTTATPAAATVGSNAAQTTASSTRGTNAGKTKAKTDGTDADHNAADNDKDASMQTAGGKTVTGWEAIATAIQSVIEEAANNTANAGEAGTTGTTGNTGTPVTVAIELNGATTVPKEILEEIKGQNVDLVLSLGNGITWTINGMNITGDTLTDIDLNVTKGADSIPADTVAKLTGGKSALQLTLAHNGQFGFEATLTINLESENAGLYANLFYYNEETGKFELLSNSEIDENGNANLTFKHASSYVIVLNTAPMKDTNDNKSDTAKSDTGSSAKAANTANTVAEEVKDNSLILFIILGIVVAAAVAGGVIYVFYKNKKEDEDIE